MGRVRGSEKDCKIAPSRQHSNHSHELSETTNDDAMSESTVRMEEGLREL